MSIETFLTPRGISAARSDIALSRPPRIGQYPMHQAMQACALCRGIFGAQLIRSLPSSTEQAWPRPSTNPRRIRRKPQPSATCSPASTSRSAAGRRKAARAHAPSAGEAGYTAKRHRGAGGAGAGAPPARHVYRRHRREGAAPSVRRGDRQRHGRGGGRPRRPASRSSSSADGFVTVTDNGRGIPVDPHPKFQNKSALEVIMTHAAFGRQVRLQGLRDLGRPARRRRLGGQRAVRRAGGRGRARPASSTGRRSRAASRRASCRTLGEAPNRRGTTVRFHPDPEIFGAKARVQARAPVQDGALQGLSVRRRRDPLVLRQALLAGIDDVPAKATFHFPGGLNDYLAADAARRDAGHPDIFAGKVGQDRQRTARVEWAVAWVADADGFVHSYCNTIPTPRAARTRPACAPRCCAACRTTPSASARASAPRRSPATT